jgi:general secretion pathway protein E
MNDPSNTGSAQPPLTASALNIAVMQARKEASELSPDVWEMLLQLCGVSEPILVNALYVQHGVVVLNDADWSRIEVATSFEATRNDPMQCIPIRLDERHYILSCDPWSSVAIASLHRNNKPCVQLALAKPSQWIDMLSRVQGAAELEQSPSPLSAKTPTHIDVVQFVNDAIAQACQEGASDIHFESHRAGLRVKYRLDGVMALGPVLGDVQKCEEVVSRIKVMAQLDITERRRPQDGRIHWGPQGREPMDLRVSVMPSIFGEDVVLRLLDKAQLNPSTSKELASDTAATLVTQSESGLSLSSLGFEPVLAYAIRDLAQRPHGMLLVTGPTGSGKTTTVYASLSEVNDGLEKIVTIEDPVEYELAGVLQIPVNEQKGLTFATGLRSILRHDPDKILVGEIRDAETAQIAVQSALTGHLVFTTVHANSLFDVLGRFQHFGIEPFALASALNGVVVQRLMRKLCPHCYQWRSLTPTEVNKLKVLDLLLPPQVPVAKGCVLCRQTGYRGRFVVAEVHVLTEPLRDLIVRKASMAELRAALYVHVEDRLLARALAQVGAAMSTLEEVSRVVGLV